MVDELGEEITKNFVVESKTIGVNFVRAELASNCSNLVCNNVE
jgi:hypothetical protein